MNFQFLIAIINILSQLIVWLVIASSLLSFILPPYHKIRQALDSIVDPLLAPIRRVVPMAGMFDFSPLILILLVDLVARLLISVLSF